MELTTKTTDGVSVQNPIGIGVPSSSPPVANDGFEQPGIRAVRDHHARSAKHEMHPELSHAFKVRYPQC